MSLPTILGFYLCFPNSVSAPSSLPPSLGALILRALLRPKVPFPPGPSQVASPRPGLSLLTLNWQLRPHPITGEFQRQEAPGSNQTAHRKTSRGSRLATNIPSNRLRGFFSHQNNEAERKRQLYFEVNYNVMNTAYQNLQDTAEQCFKVN